MNTLQIRDAKAGLSAVIAAAEKGHPTLITRHGQPSAMVVPVQAGRQLYPLDVPTLASHLLAMPEYVPTRRDLTPLRKVDLS